MLYQQNPEEEEQCASARRLRRRLLQQLEEAVPERGPRSPPEQQVPRRIDWLIGGLLLALFVAVCAGALWATVQGY